MIYGKYVLVLIYYDRIKADILQNLKHKNLKVFTKKNNTNNWIEVGVNTPEYNSIINKYGKYLKEKNIR